MEVTVWVMGPGPFPPGVINLQDLMEEASESPPPGQAGTPQNPMDTAICIFTSGTTGNNGGRSHDGGCSRRGPHKGS